MSTEEEIQHLERRLKQLQDHIAEQDTEVYRQARLIDGLLRRILRLEQRLKESGSDSPLDARDPGHADPPPHY